MFLYKTSIRLSNTDSVGVLYFADQFKLAMDAFEQFLLETGLSLQKVIHESPYLIPIVHAEGDYQAPLLVGDEITIELTVSKIGNSSFTLHSRVLKEGVEVGRASIVHVAISKETKKSIPLPQDLLTLLHTLKVPAGCA